MKSAAIAFFTLATLTVGSAQAHSRATVVDAPTISDGPDGRADTVITHTISSAGRTRLEQAVSFGPPMLKMKANLMILSGRDGKMSMIYVDTADKIYAEMDLSGMVSAMMSMTAATFKMDTTAGAFSVDSVGPGPVINGHRTIHFRTRSSSRITFSMFGDTSSTTHHITTDLYLAPDLKSGDSDSSVSSGDSTAVAMVKKMFPILPDEMMLQARRTQGNLGKYGPALKTELEIAEISPAGSRTHHQTVDVLRYERTVVPDSVFAPPADYKKVGLLDLIQLR